MCQEHYDFYLQNPAVQRVTDEIKALETNTANGKLKCKSILQFIIHHVFNIHMPLVEHFPLEHVFLAEFETMRRSKQVDVERVKKVMSDFDVPENENIAAMKRVLNFRDIETSELGPKEKYLLTEKELPSMAPPIIAIVGLFLLFCFFKWIVNPSFQIRGADVTTVESIFLQYLPLVCIFAVSIIIGLMIPSSYNFFVDRCYNLTLFKKVEDNVEVVNQVDYVKERRLRAGGYYASILGVSLGSIALIAWMIFGGGTPFTWQTVLFFLGVALALVPLLYSFSEMVLYYPVIERMKRKRVSIDLYNADRRGGLKRYHRFLYKVFLYNEGVSVILINIFWMLSIPKVWILLLIPILCYRFNHAGWAVIGWIRSVADFNKAKLAEKERLMVAPGSTENMEKMQYLNKTYATGIIPFLFFLSTSVLIPFLVAILSK